MRCSAASHAGGVWRRLPEALVQHQNKSRCTALRHAGRPHLQADVGQRRAVLRDDHDVGRLPRSHHLHAACRSGAAGQSDGPVRSSNFQISHARLCFQPAATRARSTAEHQHRESVPHSLGQWSSLQQAQRPPLKCAAHLRDDCHAIHLPAPCCSLSRLPETHPAGGPSRPGEAVVTALHTQHPCCLPLSTVKCSQQRLV